MLMYIQLDLMYYKVHYIQLGPMHILRFEASTENLLCPIEMIQKIK